MIALHLLPGHRRACGFNKRTGMWCGTTTSAFPTVVSAADRGAGLGHRRQRAACPFPARRWAPVRYQARRRIRTGPAGGIVAPLLVWAETFGTRPVLLVPTRTSRRHRSTPSLSDAPRCSLRGVLKPKVISRWPRPTAAWQAGRRRRRPRRCGQSRPRLFTVANGVGASGASVIATQTNNHGRPPSPPVGRRARHDRDQASHAFNPNPSNPIRPPDRPCRVARRARDKTCLCAVPLRSAGGPARLPAGDVSAGDRWRRSPSPPRAAVTDGYARLGSLGTLRRLPRRPDRAMGELGEVPLVTCFGIWTCPRGG